MSQGYRPDQTWLLVDLQSSPAFAASRVVLPLLLVSSPTSTVGARTVDLLSPWPMPLGCLPDPFGPWYRPRVSPPDILRSFDLTPGRRLNFPALLLPCSQAACLRTPAPPLSNPLVVRLRVQVPFLSYLDACF